MFDIKELMKSLDPKLMEETKNIIENEEYSSEKCGLSVKYNLKNVLLGCEFNNNELKLNISNDIVKKIESSIQENISNLFMQLTQSEQYMASKMMNKDTVSENDIQYIQDENGSIVIQTNLSGLFIEVSVKKEFHKAKIDYAYFQITDHDAEVLEEVIKSVFLSVFDSMKESQMKLAKKLFGNYI